MKKLLLLTLFSSLVLAGCSNKQEVELLKEQNALLLEQISQENIQKEKTNESFFEKQTECRNICEKVYKDDEERISSLPNTIALPAQYAYSQEKNACFYDAGLAISYDGSYVENKRVVNCQTNEKVLVLYTLNGEVDHSSSNCNMYNCASSLENYDFQKQIFMGK